MKAYSLGAGLMTVATVVSAATLHVDPAAVPGGDGSEQAPYATLEQARDGLRKRSGGCHEVCLHPGVYLREEPLVLEQADSGLKDHPVVWRALRPGSVELDASIRVPSEKWEHPSVAERERLDGAARSQVRCLDLDALGVKHCRAFPARFAGRGGLVELHAAGVRQPLSRWPDGFPKNSALMGEVLERGSVERGVHKPGRFRSVEDRFTRWKVERGVWLEGYWRAPWEPVFLRVASVDAATHTIAFAEALPNGIGSKYAKPPALGNGDEPWWAVNLPEEITEPGEWAVDFESKRLFWWPPHAGALKDARLADMEGPVVRFNGVSHVRWEGIRVVRGLENGIELKECESVELSGLDVQWCGGSGVSVRGGGSNVVRSCNLSDLGESGIQLTGGDRKRLRPCGHLAENNHIQRVGVLRKTYAPGILVGSEWGGGGGDGNTVGCLIRHNLVHDTPHCGILYGGNDHLIELNEVAHTVLTSSDMGALYTQGDWASQGNIVRHNFIHDNPRAVGVYLDDGDSGDSVEGNIMVRNLNGPSVCGGHHNRVVGNIVFECSRFGIYMDARGVARGYDLKSRQFQKLTALPFEVAPWSDRYPSLTVLPQKDTRLPQANSITGNVIARCPKFLHQNGKEEEFSHSLIQNNVDFGSEDPGFEDASRNHFQLRKDAPLFQQIPGFQPPPFAEMGLYRDRHRLQAVDAGGRVR